MNQICQCPSQCLESRLKPSCENLPHGHHHVIFRHRDIITGTIFIWVFHRFQKCISDVPNVIGLKCRQVFIVLRLEDGVPCCDNFLDSTNAFRWKYLSIMTEKDFILFFNCFIFSCIFCKYTVYYNCCGQKSLNELFSVKQITASSTYRCGFYLQKIQSDSCKKKINF